MHSFGLQRKFRSGIPASKLQFSRTGLQSQPGGQPHLRTQELASSRGKIQTRMNKLTSNRLGTVQRRYRLGSLFD